MLECGNIIVFLPPIKTIEKKLPYIFHLKEHVLHVGVVISINEIHNVKVQPIYIYLTGKIILLKL